MRTGLITDMHGGREGLAVALAALEKQELHKVVSLGDALECLMPKGSDASGLAFDEAAACDAGLPDLLADVTLIRGNQEERIARHVAAAKLPALLRALLNAPEQRVSRHATYVHGHQLAWRQVSEDHWCPAGDPPQTTVLAFGHHHRTALYQQLPDRDLPHELPLTSGVPVQLDPTCRYLFNLGPARTRTPAWAVLDEKALTLTAVFARGRHLERDYS